MNRQELLLLEVETARVRLAWAKAQVESGGATPALTKFVEESREELRVLRSRLPGA